ncbi:hypothetical protein ACKX2L_06470 [Lachnospiraceae bacterium YH-ros2228]
MRERNRFFSLFFLFLTIDILHKILRIEEIEKFERKAVEMFFRKGGLFYEAERNRSGIVRTDLVGFDGTSGLCG